MSATATETRWQPGQVLLDKYRVDHVLGVGGMGSVVAATHLQLDQRVALKFVHADIAKHPEAVQRFLREARAAAQIRSEHVVRVSDVGALEDGLPYMVMEYLEGEDLDNALARGLPAPEVVVEYLLQACLGLVEAHQHGIVHRDLKPANLFLSKRRDGRVTVKVLDFGISKVQQPGDSALTQTSTLMGSPLYMSPEQMTRPKEVDSRADIWALGVIAYEALTGTRPFTGEALPEICGQILALTPPPIHTLRPELPPALSAVVQRCLEKDPNARYATVSDLMAALEPFAAQAPRSRVSALPEQVLRSSPPPELQHTQQGTQGAWTEASKTAASATPTTKKSPVGLVLGALGGFVALSLGAYFALRTPSTPESAAAQSALQPEAAAAAASAPAEPVAAPAAPSAAPAAAPVETATEAAAAPPETPPATSAEPTSTSPARPAPKSAKTAAAKSASPAPTSTAARPPEPPKAATPAKPKKSNPLDIDIK